MALSIGKASVGEGDQDKLIRDARGRACALLRRREYSIAELRYWLGQKGYHFAIVTAVVDELVQAQLLSDERFAQALTRTRRDAGYGPRRIAAELRNRGVSKTLIAETLEMFEDDWVAVAARAFRKHVRRYNSCASYEARRRAIAFLVARGFKEAHWRAFLGASDDKGISD